MVFRVSFGVIIALCLGLFAPIFPSAGLAQTSEDTVNSAGETEPALSIELNGLRQVEGACRVIFMAQNTLGSDLSSLSFETVLIDTSGLVDRLTVFDFQDLPNERMRVRQFDLSGTDCESIGTVLINGVSSCEGEGIEPAQCSAALSVSSRTDVEIAG